MTPVLIFDIETIPHVQGLRRLGVGNADMSDAQIAELAFERRREKTGNDFLPLHQHQVVSIACLFRDSEGLRIRSLGSPEDSEARLIQDFYKIVERYTPQIISWNGSGFDLPVLHYRAMIQGVVAGRYWEQGDEDRDFKYNNYLSRYHSRHLDLMDLLALYGGRANAPLDELAKLCGFPGKLGIDGSKVWQAYQDGQLQTIRHYCETDVANTWLVYCRFQRMRGHWTDAHYEREIHLTRTTLQHMADQGATHWGEFLQAWPNALEPLTFNH
jgi:3'-5' exonuclease